MYSLLRVFVHGASARTAHELATEILLVLSGFTMLLGVLGALCQWEIRRILSWHIISQVGYMVMGIGLAADAAHRARGGRRDDLLRRAPHRREVEPVPDRRAWPSASTGTQRAEGDGRRRSTLAPGVAALFLVAAFSLAGMPPFSGFLAKLVLLRAGLADGTVRDRARRARDELPHALSMMKIWTYAFWGAPRRAGAARLATARLTAPTAVLVAFTVVAGPGRAAVPAARRRRGARRGRPARVPGGGAAAGAGRVRAARGRRGGRAMILGGSST